MQHVCNPIINKLAAKSNFLPTDPALDPTLLLLDDSPSHASVDPLACVSVGSLEGSMLEAGTHVQWRLHDKSMVSKHMLESKPESHFKLDRIVESDAHSEVERILRTVAGPSLYLDIIAQSL